MSSKNSQHPVTPAVPVVCLVGSSRFRRQFVEVGHRLETGGCLVLAMTFFGHTDGIDVSPEEREVLGRVDRHRIDLAGQVWVIDATTTTCAACGTYAGAYFNSPCCGAEVVEKPYLGQDTRKEVEYALATGKPVHYLSKGLPWEEVGGAQKAESVQPADTSTPVPGPGPRGKRGGGLGKQRRAGGSLDG